MGDKPNTRMTKERWLALGLEVLGNEGASGLTVERLCALAGRTRGSFYHHFEDHNDFIVAMLEHWRQQSTVTVIDAVGEINDPRERRKALMQQVAGLPSAAENAIRGWSGTDARAREMLSRVDESRLEFLRESIESLAQVAGVKLSKNEVEKLALHDYGFFVGANIVRPGATRKFYLELGTLSEEMLQAWLENKRG